VTTENNPVWTVYDTLRTVRLNVKYYGCRLQVLQRWNTSMEIALAIAAPSSSIAGLGFWKYAAGAVIWKAFGAIAAVVALLKPILFLTKRIKETEGVVSGYRGLEFDLMELKVLIEQKGRFDGPLKAQFGRAIQRLRSLVTQTATYGRPNKRLLKRCQDEVLNELPEGCFFVPNEKEENK
jgi:hypothetical protein